MLIQKDSHLLEACRYVVLNPVRARAVKSPGDWKWSSYRGTAGLDNPQSCLTADWILGQFGAKRRLARQEYIKFVAAGIKEDSIWTKVKGQVILGENDFVEEFIDYIKGRESIKEIPRNQRYINRSVLEELFKASVINKKQERDRKIREAVERHGYSQKEIADYLKMHYSTISRLVNQK